MGINAIYNIINKTLDDNISILYEPSNSLFDLDIRALPYHFYSNAEQYYSHYDIAIVNDWQVHAVNRLKFLSEHQISDLLFIHHVCPKNFKKEDKAIFENTTKNTYKIFLSQYIYDSWKPNDPRSILINYGVDHENVKNQISCENKTDSILLLNLNNKAEINGLFRTLKNYHNNIEMLSVLDHNVLPHIARSSAIIDLHNGLHTLYGILCGVRVITNQILDTKLISPTIVTNVGDISAAINQYGQNKNIDTLIQQDQQYIISSYSASNFQSKLNSVLEIMKAEAFVL